jgi:hypothetical protein
VAIPLVGKPRRAPRLFRPPTFEKSTSFRDRRSALVAA